MIEAPSAVVLVQAVLEKHDVLLIADEVICGFGRTGRMFGTETFAMKPDIMTMAKAITSGYLPLSATDGCSLVLPKWLRS